MKKINPIKPFSKIKQIFRPKKSNAETKLRPLDESQKLTSEMEALSSANRVHLFSFRKQNELPLKKFQKTIPKYRKVCYNSIKAVQPHSDLRQNYQKRGF